MAWHGTILVEIVTLSEDHVSPRHGILRNICPLARIRVPHSVNEFSGKF